MTKRLLRDIAHARSGDKGNRSNICLFVFNDEHYPVVAGQITAERLKDEFGGLFAGEIKRYDLPQHGGFNFVLDEALEGGVNESLNLDSHGKSWSSLMLGLSIEID